MTTIKALRARLRANHTYRGLMAVANAGLAEGEATFLYAQHCDLDDAVLAIRDAARFGAIAARAIAAARRAKSK